MEQAGRGGSELNVGNSNKIESLDCAIEDEASEKSDEGRADLAWLLLTPTQPRPPASPGS